MKDEDTERLEVKISYLEVQNEELNEVVISQGKEIALLNMKLEMLEKKVTDLFEEMGGADRPNRRPPHY